MSRTEQATTATTNILPMLDYNGDELLDYNNSILYYKWNTQTVNIERTEE